MASGCCTICNNWRTIAKSATVQYGKKMPELKKAINLSEKPTG